MRYLLGRLACLVECHDWGTDVIRANPDILFRRCKRPSCKAVR